MFRGFQGFSGCRQFPEMKKGNMSTYNLAEELLGYCGNGGNVENVYKTMKVNA